MPGATRGTISNPVMTTTVLAQSKPDLGKSLEVSRTSVRVTVCTLYAIAYNLQGAQEGFEDNVHGFLTLLAQGNLSDDQTRLEGTNLKHTGCSWQVRMTGTSHLIGRDLP